MSTLNSFLTDIADAIREKEGSSDPINAQDFSTRIRSLSGGDGYYYIQSNLPDNFLFIVNGVMCYPGEATQVPGGEMVLYVQMALISTDYEPIENVNGICLSYPSIGDDGEVFEESFEYGLFPLSHPEFGNLMLMTTSFEGLPNREVTATLIYNDE